MELEHNLPKIRRQGLGLAAISYDSPAILKRFAAEHQLTYPLLSDAGSVVITRYGILNKAAFGRAKGVPHPGTFIVDRSGVVQSRYFEQEYQVRTSAAVMLAQMEGANNASGPATNRAATDQIIASWSASDTQVAPGTSFALIVDITPKPKMHVYAPGQSGYIPVSLTLDMDPLFVAEKPHFPAPSDYYFAPLKEHVKVYERPFRLVQQVHMKVTPETRRGDYTGKTMVIKGTLNYQACDDKACYNPAAIPMSWSVHMQKLVLPPAPSGSR